MRGLTIYVIHITVKMYLTEDSIIKFHFLLNRQMRESKKQGITCELR